MSRAEEIFQRVKSEGMLYIEELISTQTSEELFLDFKRSSDNGEGKYISTQDRGNLAKAISGFGNSEGGVIIWGIDCRRRESGADYPEGKFPIVNVRRFISQIEGIVSGLTLPAISKVENYGLEIKKGENGYAITYIPKSPIAPIQAIYNKHFYIRAGSNFEIVPYQVLAGMFGRRPQPSVFTKFVVGTTGREDDTIAIQVGFLLLNTGPGIAKDIFINVTVSSIPGENSSVEFDTPDRNNWTGNFSFGAFLNLISNEDLRLAPGAHLQPVILRVKFKPPFNKEFKIEIMCGCEGSTVRRTNLKCDVESLKVIYEKAIRSMEWDFEFNHKIATDIMGRDNDFGINI